LPSPPPPIYVSNTEELNITQDANKSITPII
jgi:hypothetical protein